MYKTTDRTSTILNMKELLLNITEILKRNLKNQITEIFKKRARKELKHSVRE